MHPLRSSENVVLKVLVILGDIFVYFRDLGNLGIEIASHVIGINFDGFNSVVWLPDN